MVANPLRVKTMYPKSNCAIVKRIYIYIYKRGAMELLNMLLESSKVDFGAARELFA